jgi:hypothetical protein
LVLITKESQLRIWTKLPLRLSMTSTKTANKSAQGMAETDRDIGGVLDHERTIISGAQLFTA